MLFFHNLFIQQLKSSRNEYLKLKARVENLQRTQRLVVSFITSDNSVLCINKKMKMSNFF